MKRVFLLVLVLCALLTSVPAVSVLAETPAEPVPAEELPSSYTLVGTKHLPPISNQGNIGTCSSSSITYMQFSNAVSRYIHSIDPKSEWNPSSGEAQYLFSPKFTYNFAGSGTEWVYRILMENGALTWDKSYFATKSDGSYDQEAVKNAIPTQTTSWDVGAGAMETAMNYRLTNFEQIWLRTTDDSYGVNGKIQITQTAKGQALINKIKDAVVNGNVVVTGGLSSTWGGGYEYNAVIGNTGGGRKGDSVLYCGRGAKSGGHQICIVGYDDNVIAEVTNKEGGKTRLKGGFLIANSWGEAWMNDGYCWFMYDSVNEVSEYEELNFDDRQAPLDQFCFVYWDKDVKSGKPDMYMEVSVITADRTNFTLTLLGENEEGFTRKYKPYLFEYAGHHGDYGETRHYNFAGQPARKNLPSVGQFAFSLEEMYGSDINKFIKYGVRVTASNGEEVKVAGITLKNSLGKVIKQVAFSGDDAIVGTEKNFFIDSVKMIGVDTLPTIEGASIEYVDSLNYYTEGSEVRFTVTPKQADAKFVLKLDGVVLKADADGIYTAKLTPTSALTYEVLESTQQPGEGNTETDGNSGNNKDDGDESSSPIVWIIVVCAVAAVGAVALVIVKIGKKKGK